jgi:transposase
MAAPGYVPAGRSPRDRQQPGGERDPAVRRRRKAWLFSGSPRGAEASAVLYTLVETAMAVGLEPRAYLHYLFETLPTVTTPDGIETLLPHRLTPELLKIPAPEL